MWGPWLGQGRELRAVRLQAEAGLGMVAVVTVGEREGVTGDTRGLRDAVCLWLELREGRSPLARVAFELDRVAGGSLRCHSPCVAGRSDSQAARHTGGKGAPELVGAGHLLLAPCLLHSWEGQADSVALARGSGCSEVARRSRKL